MKTSSKILFIGLIALGMTIAARGGKPEKKEEPILLTVDGKGIPLSEFSYVYNKNNANNSEAYSEKNLREYLDLYIKFRLKVREAEALGIDTTLAFKSEFDGYKKQLAQPYLTEKGLNENMIKEAYQRLTEEVRVSHIMLRLSQDADPVDSLKAYNKMLDIKKKIEAGADFAEMAKKYSEDNGANQNGGDLGYFTALQMIYNFETAAYNTPVGGISNVVRTKFGYHLLKVHARRKSQGTVRTAHIMIRYTAGTSPTDSLEAYKKINDVYNKLKQGGDWTVLCGQFSDDANTKLKGGELQAFSVGEMLPTFEEAAFALQNVNDLSAPFQTPYGFHVVKLLERQPLPSFDAMESTLRSKVNKDSRIELSKELFIKRVKVQNNYKENPKALNYLSKVFDSTLLKGTWKMVGKSKENQIPLFTIAKKEYSVYDFLEYTLMKQRNRVNINLPRAIRYYVDEYAVAKLTEYEESILESKYNDYRLLLKEYKEGIMLFTLMDTKVWSKAMEDTLGIKRFFEENRANYAWKKRAQAAIFSCKDAATREKVKKMLDNVYNPVFWEKSGTLTFAKGKSDISKENLKSADILLNTLNRDRTFLVELSATSEKGELPVSKPSLATKRNEALVKYLTSKGVSASRILTKDKGVVAPTKDGSARGISYQIVTSSLGVIDKVLNKDDGTSLNIREGLYQEGEDEVLAQAKWSIGFATLEYNTRYYLIWIKKIEAPRPKLFEEAKGQVISDFQNELEKRWLNELKAKYKVEVNEAVLKSLIK